MKGEGYGFDVIRQMPVTVRDRRYLAGFRARFNCSATDGATCAEGGVLTVIDVQGCTSVAGGRMPGATAVYKSPNSMSVLFTDTLSIGRKERAAWCCT